LRIGKLKVLLLDVHTASNGKNINLSANWIVDVNNSDSVLDVAIVNRRNIRLIIQILIGKVNWSAEGHIADFREYAPSG
jgi:hypothetical protein